MSSSGKKRSTLVADKRYPDTKSAKPKRKPAAKKKPAKRKPAKKPNTLLRVIGKILLWSLRLSWGVGWRVGIVASILVGIGVAYDYTTLPSMSYMVDGRARGSVTLQDRNNKTFAWRGDQFGGMITTQTVSPHLKNAVIATEDKRFYSHYGISPRGIASAVRINLRAGRGPLSGNGGSTLTQQTAKLLCLGKNYNLADGLSEKEFEADCRRGSLWRKIKEATYALALEAKFNKDEILSIYLNRAYLGAGSRGFEAASQRYFDKSSSDISPAEAAMLAGLLKAPTRFAPTNDLQRSQDRALTVLKLMFEQGYLTEVEAAEAGEYPAVLSGAAQARAGGYFADWVMSSGPSFLTRETTEDVIIRTTLDADMQKSTEEALRYIFENKLKSGSKVQAAVIVMSSDGAVRAMVGGRETKVIGAFNRATQALRQTGSTFKPFVYAAALDLGHGPTDLVMDDPITIPIRGSKDWEPKNYGDKYYGQVTLIEALQRSMNTATVRVAQSVGLDNVRTVATGFGIRHDLADGPALALGVSESTLIEMTSAYAGILNGGRAVVPYGLVELRLLGDEEPLMQQEGGMGERVISKAAASGLTYMMSQVIESGTGARARLSDRQAAGKTGTTQMARDAWFIGFTADYVTGVWMGYDDNTPLTGVTGGGLPAEIWRETMQRVHKDLPPLPLPMYAPERFDPFE